MEIVELRILFRKMYAQEFKIVIISIKQNIQQKRLKKINRRTNKVFKKSMDSLQKPREDEDVKKELHGHKGFQLTQKFEKDK